MGDKISIDSGKLYLVKHPAQEATILGMHVLNYCMPQLFYCSLSWTLLLSLQFLQRQDDVVVTCLGSEVKWTWIQS